MFVTVCSGLWGGLLIGLQTEYFTSNRCAVRCSSGCGSVGEGWVPMRQHFQTATQLSQGCAALQCGCAALVTEDCQPLLRVLWLGAMLQSTRLP